MKTILPGIYSISLPLPFRLREVNVYLLRDDRGYTLIDTGPYSGKAIETLEEELASLSASWQDIHTVLLTHYHCDHCGLAAEIQRRSDALIYMSQMDFDVFESFCEHPQEAMSAEELSVHHGMPIGMARKVEEEAVSFLDLVAPFSPGEFFGADTPIHRAPYTFIPISTPGHTAGHTCLYEERTGILFCGDHVLDRISPNISAYPANPLLNPLRSYLQSLEKLSELEVTMTLPAHGQPVSSLPERIGAIHLHHEERKTLILDALKDSPACAYAISEKVFGNDLDPLDHWMALCETLAHLISMEYEGRVRRGYSAEEPFTYWAR